MMVSILGYIKSARPIIDSIYWKGEEGMDIPPGFLLRFGTGGFFSRSGVDDRVGS